MHDFALFLMKSSLWKLFCDVLLTSPSLQSKNTTITTAMLGALGRTVEANEPHIMSALRLADPVTKSLFCNYDYENHDIKVLLAQLRETNARLREAGGEAGTVH